MSKNAVLLSGLSKRKEKKDEIELEKNVVLASFDFNQIEVEEREFLEGQTIKIQLATTKMYSELGKIFFETQEKLSNNKNGVFEKWYILLGFKKNNVYRLINRWKYIVSNWENKHFIESLPVSLSYEISNENCNEELIKMVFEGKIKTYKEFMEYKELENKDKKVKQIERIEYNDILPGAVEELDKINESIKRVYKTMREENKPKLLKLIEKFEKEVEKILD